MKVRLLALDSQCSHSAFRDVDLPIEPFPGLEIWVEGMDNCYVKHVSCTANTYKVTAIVTEEDDGEFTDKFFDAVTEKGQFKLEGR